MLKQVLDHFKLFTPYKVFSKIGHVIGVCVLAWLSATFKGTGEFESILNAAFIMAVGECFQIDAFIEQQVSKGVKFWDSVVMWYHLQFTETLMDIFFWNLMVGGLIYVLL